jgi:phosphohistidine phosphatase
MKTVYLIRHAKSDWAIENIPDVDRPLNQRGYNDVHKMSAVIKEKKIIPDLIVSSPAIRAITTALVFSRTLEYDPGEILVIKKLYHSEVKDYLSAIRELDDKYNTVLFGHNEIITKCVNTLVDSFTNEMSTCSIAGISSPATKWELFKEEKNELIFFDFPKNHHE